MHFTSLVCYKMATIYPGDGSGVSKRRKTRRGKRCRNEEDRRKLINDYMKQRKHRVAPSNTTQFLIEDREKVEPILYLSPRSSLSGLSSPEAEGNTELEFDLSLSAEEDHFDEQFFLKDFEATYRQLYRENLYALPKSELLDKVKKLEGKRDVLERERRGCCAEAEHDNCANTNKHASLTNEFQQLQQQNDLLREENEMLKKTKDLDMKMTTDIC